MQHARAYHVLQEVSRLHPTSPLPCLLAARLCLEHLSLPEKGLKEAEKALEREQAHPQGLVARCQVAKGLALEMMASAAKTQKDRQELGSKAFEAFGR